MLPAVALEGGNAVEAINDVDGDGGSINVDKFTGLSQYLRVMGIPIQQVEVPKTTLVQFREVFHDAIELGHQNTVTLGMYITFYNLLLAQCVVTHSCSVGYNCQSTYLSCLKLSFNLKND